MSGIENHMIDSRLMLGWIEGLISQDRTWLLILYQIDSFMEYLKLHVALFKMN